MRERKGADPVEVRGMKEERNSTGASALILQFLKPDYVPTFLQLGGSVRYPFLEKPLLAKTSPSLVPVTHNDPRAYSVQIIPCG